MARIDEFAQKPALTLADQILGIDSSISNPDTTEAAIRATLGNVLTVIENNIDQLGGLFVVDLTSSTPAPIPSRGAVVIADEIYVNNSQNVINVTGTAVDTESERFAFFTAPNWTLFTGGGGIDQSNNSANTILRTNADNDSIVDSSITDDGSAVTITFEGPSSPGEYDGLTLGDLFSDPFLNTSITLVTNDGGAFTPTGIDSEYRANGVPLVALQDIVLITLEGVQHFVVITLVLQDGLAVDSAALSIQFAGQGVDGLTTTADVTFESFTTDLLGNTALATEVANDEIAIPGIIDVEAGDLLFFSHATHAQLGTFEVVNSLRTGGNTLITVTENIGSIVPSGIAVRRLPVPDRIQGPDINIANFSNTGITDRNGDEIVPVSYASATEIISIGDTDVDLSLKANADLSNVMSDFLAQSDVEVSDDNVLSIGTEEVRLSQFIIDRGGSAHPIESWTYVSRSDRTEIAFADGDGLNDFLELFDALPSSGASTNEVVLTNQANDQVTTVPVGTIISMIATEPTFTAILAGNIGFLSGNISEATTLVSGELDTIVNSPIIVADPSFASDNGNIITLTGAGGGGTGEGLAGVTAATSAVRRLDFTAAGFSTLTTELLDYQFTFEAGAEEIDLGVQTVNVDAVNIDSFTITNITQGGSPIEVVDFTGVTGASFLGRYRYNDSVNGGPVGFVGIHFDTQANRGTFAGSDGVSFASTDLIRFNIAYREVGDFILIDANTVTEDLTAENASLQNTAVVGNFEHYIPSANINVPTLVGVKATDNLATVYTVNETVFEVEGEDFGNPDNEHTTGVVLGVLDDIPDFAAGGDAIVYFPEYPDAGIFVRDGHRLSWAQPFSNGRLLTLPIGTEIWYVPDGIANGSFATQFFPPIRSFLSTSRAITSRQPRIELTNLPEEEPGIGNFVYTNNGFLALSGRGTGTFAGANGRDYNGFVDVNGDYIFGNVRADLIDAGDFNNTPSTTLSLSSARFPLVEVNDILMWPGLTPRGFKVLTRSPQGETVTLDGTAPAPDFNEPMLVFKYSEQIANLDSGAIIAVNENSNGVIESGISTAENAITLGRSTVVDGAFEVNVPEAIAFPDTDVPEVTALGILLVDEPLGSTGILVAGNVLDNVDPYDVIIFQGIPAITPKVVNNAGGSPFGANSSISFGGSDQALEALAPSGTTVEIVTSMVVASIAGGSISSADRTANRLRLSGDETSDLEAGDYVSIDGDPTRFRNGVQLIDTITYDSNTGITTLLLDSDYNTLTRNGTAPNLRKVLLRSPQVQEAYIGVDFQRDASFLDLRDMTVRNLPSGTTTTVLGLDGDNKIISTTASGVITQAQLDAKDDITDVNNKIRSITLESLENVVEVTVPIGTADYTSSEDGAAAVFNSGAVQVVLEGDIRSSAPSPGDKIHPIIGGVASANFYCIVNEVQTTLTAGDTVVECSGASQALIDYSINNGFRISTAEYLIGNDLITGWHDDTNLTFEGIYLVRNASTGNWETLDEITATSIADGNDSGNPLSFETYDSVEDLPAEADRDAKTVYIVPGASSTDADIDLLQEEVDNLERSVHNLQADRLPVTKTHSTVIDLTSTAVELANDGEYPFAGTNYDAIFERHGNQLNRFKVLVDGDDVRWQAGDTIGVKVYAANGTTSTTDDEYVGEIHEIDLDNSNGRRQITISLDDAEGASIVTQNRYDAVFSGAVMGYYFHHNQIELYDTAEGVLVEISAPLELNNGFILESPNGTRYQYTAANDGSLITTQL